MNSGPKIKFAFFGSSRLSVIVLDELEKAGFIPACIVTTPDKPKGRKLTVTPNVVKEWAINKKIRIYDPAKLDAAFIEMLKKESCDLFIVASYGKIIPSAIINLPPHKTLNIHPSLLPKYRGPSPLPSAMLDDAKRTGVTIMRLDEEMDHGPIVAQQEITVEEWPTYEDFEEMMARKGAQLLARILPDWVAGKIKELEQDHSKATYTKKITKEDGLLDLNKLDYAAFRKIQAFHEWPQAFFFISKDGKKQRSKDAEKIRVKVTQASFKKDLQGNAGTLIIEKVIPEGKSEMPYADFARGYLKPPKQ
jgi:methionyl-tRNA formyltransferase